MNTHIESDKIHIGKPRKELFEHFSKPVHFRDIMPEDVEKFEADDDWFVFGLKGLPEVKLVLDSLVPDEQISFKSASDKLQFELVARFDALSSEATEAQLIFNGQFNPMLKMMVTRPLQNFLKKLSDNLKTL